LVELDIETNDALALADFVVVDVAAAMVFVAGDFLLEDDNFEGDEANVSRCCSLTDGLLNCCCTRCLLQAETTQEEDR
jgi:hypothetical protein